MKVDYHDQWAVNFGKTPTCRELREVNAAADAWEERRGIVRKSFREINNNQAYARKRRQAKTVSRPQRAKRRAEMVARLWDGKRWKPRAQRTPDEQREFILLMNYRRAAERREQQSGIPNRVRDTSRTRGHLERL